MTVLVFTIYAISVLAQVPLKNWAWDKIHMLIFYWEVVISGTQGWKGQWGKAKTKWSLTELTKVSRVGCCITLMSVVKRYGKVVSQNALLGKSWEHLFQARFHTGLSLVKIVTGLLTPPTLHHCVTWPLWAMETTSPESRVAIFFTVSHKDAEWSSMWPWASNITNLPEACSLMQQKSTEPRGKMLWGHDLGA